MRATALEALERLREGNRRFVSGMPIWDGPSRITRRAELRAGQEPIAIVLGCSDSRVPAEIVFDQGFGDLFVVRVAGNVAAATQVESIEFAVEQLGARLVVVLGHSQCGAVLATLEELQRPANARSGSLRSIVNHIKPAVEGLLAGAPPGGPEALASAAVRANVRASANRLREDSTVLRGLIENGGLLVVGAEYSLETGVVDVFDGAPEAD